MKKGVVVFTGFAFLLAFSVPAVAQPSSKAVETRIIDNFDHVGSQDYQVPCCGTAMSPFLPVISMLFLGSTGPVMM